MKTFSPEDNGLYERIDEVAHYVWDPIGVAGAPQARDEYDTYILALVERVKAGSLESVIEYMRIVQSESMGLPFEKERAIEAAEIMLEWKELLNGST